MSSQRSSGPGFPRCAGLSPAQAQIEEASFGLPLGWWAQWSASKNQVYYKCFGTSYGAWTRPTSCALKSVPHEIPESKGTPQQLGMPEANPRSFSQWTMAKGRATAIQQARGVRQSEIKPAPGNLVMRMLSGPGKVCNRGNKGWQDTNKPHPTETGWHSARGQVSDQFERLIVNETARKQNSMMHNLFSRVKDVFTGPQQKYQAAPVDHSSDEEISYSPLRSPAPEKDGFDGYSQFK